MAVYTFALGKREGENLEDGQISWRHKLLSLKEADKYFVILPIYLVIFKEIM